MSRLYQALTIIGKTVWNTTLLFIVSVCKYLHETDASYPLIKVMKPMSLE